MNHLKTFLQNFLNRSGSYVFIATVSSRILSFFASWIAVQLIPNKELGIVLFAYNIVIFLLPFSGLGLYHSLIRFSPFLKTKEEKQNLFYFVLKKGLTISIPLVLLIIGIGYFIPFDVKAKNFYLALLAIIILPDYIFQVLKIKFRIDHNNKKFALAEVLYNSILVISIYLLSLFYKENGYAVALLLTPLLTSLLFAKNIRFEKIERPKIVTREFWKYGVFSGLTSVVSQLLISVDILLIGILISNPEFVTVYKYISIIPLSILFLSHVFMSTDFVTLTERIYDKSYILKYIKNYISLFILISIGIVLISYVFSENMLSFFGSEFIPYQDSFVILILGSSSILILRGLFGNLLCSIGKINSNLYIALIAIAINCIGNYYLIPKYGIKGAAITSASMMWLTSILSCLVFFYLYKKFLKSEFKENISA